MLNIYFVCICVCSFLKHGMFSLYLGIYFDKQRSKTGIYLQMFGEMVLALTSEQDTHGLVTRVWLNYIYFGYPFHLPKEYQDA